MSRRLAKVNEAIRESVSTTVLFGLKDPRVKNVTVLRAEVSGDLHYAKVYVSVRGDDREKALCLHGLEAAKGFIQHKLADRMRTRYTPQLTFILDRGVEMAAATSAILNQVLPRPESDPAAADAAEAYADENDAHENDVEDDLTDEVADRQNGDPAPDEDVDEPDADDLRGTSEGSSDDPAPDLATDRPPP